MRKHAIHLVACGLAMWLAGVGAASAGAFAVSPVRATLSATRGTDSLTVRNNGTEASVVQLEVVSWSQQQGEDVFTPSREVLATPPIFTVPPGGSQVVRVGLRRAPDATRELSYRLFLQEVPPPPKPGFSGLQMALRISVPIFVQPAATARPVLQWRVKRGADGAFSVGLSNSGTAHVQVASFALAGADGAPFVSRQVAAYLLADQSRLWQFEKVDSLPAPGARLRIIAQTDAGEMQSETTLEQP